MKDYCTSNCPHWNQAEEYCEAAEMADYSPEEFAKLCPAYQKIHNDE